jgi:hypothetical protein
MAVNGVWSQGCWSNTPGTINTTGTFNKTQTFNPPANLLALPLLQQSVETGGQTEIDSYISEYVDNGVTHTGRFMGVAATKCTKIVWSMYTNDAVNNPARLIFFF